MKIKNNIRHKISQQLDVLIPEGKWDQYIEILDREGIPNRKQLIGIFMIVCQQVEMLENLMEDAYFRIETLEGSSPIAKTPSSVTFKLRTATDVTRELESEFTPDTKAFYLSNDDFKILEKSVDPDLAKTKPEYGYGKERDPKDGIEKTCLYFKDLPVFRNKK